jgi:hypothetical protein
MPLIEIHVKGRIDPSLSDWFQGLTVHSVSSDELCLTSEAIDNSAIYGILSSLGSLGLTLISVSVSDKDEEIGTIHSDT